MALLQALAGLALVLAAIGAAAWLLRRLAAGRALPGQLLRLHGALAVGPRERIVVVEIEGTRLVLGVAPGRVSALHALAPSGRAATTPVPAPAPAPAGTAPQAPWTS